MGQQAEAEQFLFQASQNNGVLAAEITWRWDVRQFWGLPHHLTKHFESSLLCSNIK